MRYQRFVCIHLSNLYISGQHRLNDAQDILRREIATALKREVRLIPTLVDGATMPAAKDLPSELQPLTKRQAHEIPDQYWDDGIKKLIATIEQVLAISANKERTPRGPKPQPAPPPTAQPLPASLPELFPGNWQIQPRHPLPDIIGQITLEIFPQGMFRGRIAKPPGVMTVVEGRWQIMAGNQVVLQGREITPMGFLPYGFATQFIQIGPYQLTAVTSAGEEMVWQRIG